MADPVSGSKVETNRTHPVSDLASTYAHKGAHTCTLTCLQNTHTHTGTLESPWARTLAHCTAGRTGLSPPSDCLGAPRHQSLPCSLLGKFPEVPFSQDTQATSSPGARALAGGEEGQGGEFCEIPGASEHPEASSCFSLRASIGHLQQPHLSQTAACRIQ